VSVVETSKDQSNLANAASSHADRKPESRACIRHIYGGIAMLAIGIGLLIIT
jgi:hypothetical protein